MTASSSSATPAGPRRTGVSRGPPRRPRRGSARPARARPVPLAGGRGQRRDPGVAAGPGHAVGQRGGGAAGEVPVRGPARRADGRRVRQRPGLARAAAVLHAPPARAGARGAADGRARGAGAGARRPGRPGPGRADHSRFLAAGPGGPAPRLPAVLRRGRGVGTAGHGRGVRRAGRRPHRPLPLLPGRLAAGRQGVLLRPQAPAGPGPRGRGSVSPPGVPAHGRHAHPARTC